MRHRIRSVRDSLRGAMLGAHRFRIGLSGESSLSVFMYHRVVEDGDREWGPWRYAVTPATFENHVATIVDRYEVLSMDDALSAVTGERGELPAQSAVLTFDDGYEDTLSEAIPIMERYDAPATVYVSTGLLGHPDGPFEFRLANALRTVDPSTVELPDVGIDLPEELPADTRTAYEVIRRATKHAPLAPREGVLEAITERATTVPSTPMLTTDQVRTLAAHPLVSIGAHGHEHVPLTSLSERSLRENVDTCARTLADVLGSTPSHFSFPYGANHEVVRDVVADAGFHTAVTTEPRVTAVGSLTNDLFAIPRIDGARFGP